MQTQSTSLSLNLKAPSSGIYYVFGTVESTSSITTPTISGPSGLTWIQRATTGVQTVSGTNYILTAWYVNTASLTSNTQYSITLSMGATGEMILEGLSISNVNPNSPFDSNLATPVQASGTGSSESVSVKTINSNDLIVGIIMGTSNSNPNNQNLSGNDKAQLSNINAGQEYQINTAAGTQSVSYSYSAGSWWMFGDAITPTSIFLSPFEGDIGSPITVTVTGSGFAANSLLSATFGGSTVSLSGSHTTSTTGNLPSDMTFTVTPSTTGAQFVVVTDASSDTASATVTANSAPTASVSPTSLAMDDGQTETFTATPSGGSGTFMSYQWYVNGVLLSGQTASTLAYSFVSLGPYSIAVTVTDSLGVTSVKSAAATITVAASPTVSITPVGPLTLTAGQIQTFTATAGGGSGTINYQWYLDGSEVGSNSASYSYTAAGTSHTVTCKVTDSASTPVTSPASNAASVTVDSPAPSPSPQPTATPTPTSTPAPTATPTPTTISTTTPTPTTTSTPSLSPTPNPSPTATPTPESTSTPMPTATSISTSGSTTPNPSATPLPSQNPLDLSTQT